MAANGGVDYVVEYHGRWSKVALARILNLLLHIKASRIYDSAILIFCDLLLPTS